MKTFERNGMMQVLRGERVTKLPVWLMRQAGRYLPEYQAVRSEHDFFSMVRTPKVATEITLQPIRRFKLDAAIIFSDILVVPQALGITVLMEEKKGPIIPIPIRSAADVAALSIDGFESRMQYLSDSVGLTARTLDGECPLIGFAGSPWSLFAYAVEGSGKKSFAAAKAFLYNEPQLSQTFLALLTEGAIRCLKVQIAAGASVVQLFESWGSLLSPTDYERLVLPHIQKIVKEIEPLCPLILFVRGNPAVTDMLAQVTNAPIGIDYTVDLPRMRARFPTRILQGALDPTVLLGPAAEIKKQTHSMLESLGKDNLIANLGHGILPEVKPEAVATFVEAVREF